MQHNIDLSRIARYPDDTFFLLRLFWKAACYYIALNGQNVLTWPSFCMNMREILREVSASSWLLWYDNAVQRWMDEYRWIDLADAQLIYLIKSLLHTDPMVIKFMMAGNSLYYGTEEELERYMHETMPEFWDMMFTKYPELRLWSNLDKIVTLQMEHYDEI